MDDHKPNIRGDRDNTKDSQELSNDKTFMWERHNGVGGKRKACTTQTMAGLAAKLRGVCEDAIGYP